MSSISKLSHDACGSIENSTTQMLVRINGDAERRIEKFAEGDANSAVFGGHAFIGGRADVSIGYVDAFPQHFVSVSPSERFEELQVVVKEAVRCIAADRERVIHDSPYFAEVVNYGEAVELIHDVLCIAAVRHEVEPLPVSRNGICVQVESNAVSDDIQGDVFSSRPDPVVASLSADFRESEQVLIAQVAHAMRPITHRLHERKISSAYSHKTSSTDYAQETQ